MSKLGPDFSTMGYDDSVKLLDIHLLYTILKLRKYVMTFLPCLMKQNHK